MVTTGDLMGSAGMTQRKVKQILNLNHTVEKAKITAVLLWSKFKLCLYTKSKTKS